MNILEVNHLKKYYGKHRGVEDVDFQIREGEILALSVQTDPERARRFAVHSL